MATDEIKEMIVDGWFGRDTTVKDWKRISKRLMGPDKVEVRTFECAKKGTAVWTFGEADDECIHPAEEHLYFLGESDGELMVCFNPVSYWNKEKCLWDQHCGFQITTVYDLPEWLELDEVCENQHIVMLPEDKTEEDVRAALEAAGLISDQSFNDFMAQY